MSGGEGATATRRPMVRAALESWTGAVLSVAKKGRGPLSYVLLLCLVGLGLYGGRHVWDEGTCTSAIATDRQEDWLAYADNPFAWNCAPLAAERLLAIPCEGARELDSVEGWIAYSTEQPGGSCAELAASRLAELPCEEATAVDTEVGWRQYLDVHPDGPCAALASKRLREIPCELKRGVDTVVAWTEYVTTNPDGPCAEEARRRVREIPCEVARDLDSQASWTSLLAEHPDSGCDEEAAERLLMLPCEDARVKDTQADWELYLATNPGGPCAEEAIERLTAYRCGRRQIESAVARETTTFRDGPEEVDVVSGTCLARCVNECETFEWSVFRVRVSMRSSAWELSAGAYASGRVMEEFRNYPDGTPGEAALNALRVHCAAVVADVGCPTGGRRGGAWGVLDLADRGHDAP